MSITPDAQAILLLTAHLPKARTDSVRPLTVLEWGRLVAWLRDNTITPADLLTPNPSDLLDGWVDKTVTLDRIETLLSRGAALALSLDKWQRSGLWVMNRSEPDYPGRLKAKLGTKAPPVLFGAGSRGLLKASNTCPLAVVGSRNATDADLEYSRDMGRRAASSGCSVVSGGARGIDEAAMLGALETEGDVIGVLSNGLLRACVSAKYRRHLMNGNLALVSPFNPEAGFNAGNAMDRNKYIYCLSEAAIVVHSDTRGGTWSGAVENLRNDWIPLWVKRNRTAVGSKRLVERGAHWLSDVVSEVNIPRLVQSGTAGLESSDATDDGLLNITRPYDAFLLGLQLFCAGSPRAVEEIHELWPDLRKDQIKKWLRLAEEDGILEKLSDNGGTSIPRWMLRQRNSFGKGSSKSEIQAEMPLKLI